MSLPEAERAGSTLMNEGGEGVSLPRIATVGRAWLVYIHEETLSLHRPQILNRKPTFIFNMPELQV